MGYLHPRSRRFTIQQLSEKLNVPKPTLRFWEKELDGIIVPLRTTGGQRRYTEENIAVLEEIKNLRDSGKSLYEIKIHLNNSDGRDNADSDCGNIDLLSERIAEVVRSEISKFFQNR